MIFNDRRSILFGTDTLTPREIRSQIPYRAASGYATLEEAYTEFTGGTVSDINGETAIKLNSVNGANATTNHTYVDALPLAQYIMLPIYISSLSNLLEFRIFFRDVFNGANYFRYNGGVPSGIKTGFNIFIVNKAEFIASGAADWANCKYLEFHCQAKAGLNCEARFGKIETYNMAPLCTISFDDGEITHFTNAWSYMKTKTPSIVGCDAIITDTIGDATHFSEANVRELIAAGWDIQNHTKNHIDLSTLTEAEADYQTSKAMEYLIGIGAGKGAFQISIPFSGAGAIVEKVSRKYATIKKVWNIPGYYNKQPVLDTYHLETFSVEYNVTLATVKGWIDEAIANQYYLVLLFHMINDTGLQYTWPIADFQAVIDYLDTNKALIKTVTMTQALYRM